MVKWLNGWVFVHELSGRGIESSCSHLNFRYRAYFKQGVPWHSGSYKVWIHSETRTWHDKNIQASRIILLIFLYNNTFLYGILFILHYVLSLDLAYIKVFVPYNILLFRNIIAIQITKTIDVIRLNWLRLDSYMNGILFRRNKQFALLLVHNDRV